MRKGRPHARGERVGLGVGLFAGVLLVSTPAGAQPELEPDPTRRAHASAEGLLERHGVVTRGAVTSERVPGGFAGVYKVLTAFEDSSSRHRRGHSRSSSPTPALTRTGRPTWAPAGRGRPSGRRRR